MLDDLMPKVLEFEKLHWRYVGSKADAIRERFGLGVTNYYQLLNRVIDTDEALAIDPMLVQRLRSRRKHHL